VNFTARSKGVNWVVFGDYKYGEEFSPENAALETTFGRAINVKFLCLHPRDNLNKQGKFTFADPADYNRIQPYRDPILLLGLTVLNLIYKKDLKQFFCFLFRNYVTGCTIEFHVCFRCVILEFC
jgi:hypothetical protein